MQEKYSCNSILVGCVGYVTSTNNTHTTLEGVDGTVAENKYTHSLLTTKFRSKMEYQYNMHDNNRESGNKEISSIF